MRTLMLLVLVAFLVAVGMAFAVGLVTVTTEHPNGQYVVLLTVNTSMTHHATATEPDGSPDSSSQGPVEMKGTITAVRPDQNEFAMSENVKNWTFQLAKDGKVFLNDRETKLADLQAGDEATVTADRQGQQLIASVVRSTRK